MRTFAIWAALALVVLAGSESQAANRRARPTAAGNGYVANGQSQPGAFSRVMELERRKNAALRQMFFGR